MTWWAYSLGGQQGIAVERRPFLNVLFGFGLQSAFLPVLRNGRSDFSKTLHYSDDYGFVFTASSGDAPLTLSDVHVSRFTADEGFINFNFSTQFADGSVLQGEPNTVKHEPCGFLGDLQIAGDLVRTHATLAVGNQPNSGKPLVQAKRGILEDGSHLDGELSPRMLGGTFPQSATGKEVNFGRATTRTGYAASPAPSDNVVQAVVGVGEVQHCLLQGLCFLTHDVPHKQNRNTRLY